MILSCQNISKSFGTDEILKNVSFHIEENEKAAKITEEILKENPDFLKVFFIIIAVQACIVNAKRVPFVVFDWIGSMFSCVPFSMKGWIVVALLAMTMIPVDLLRKCIQNTKNR